MIKKVILVFKTHFDIGFTDLSEKVLDWYCGPMLHELLRAFDETADMGKLGFVWTMPAMPLAEMLERCDEADRPRLERMIRERRVAWHALPFTFHTDFCGVEDLIRSLHYSRELSRKYGIPEPVSAKMSDVPGHGRILPAVLSAAGVEFLHLGSNEFARSPDVPALFFWDAPDASRVLTMYYPDGYGSSLTPPPNWEYPVWIAFQHTHDNMGPQNADSIRAIVEETKAVYPDAEIISGTMDDFYNELKKSDLSGVPVIKSDLADSWIHGVGSFPAEVMAVRQTRVDTMRLEALLALFRDNDENQKRAVGHIYDDLALFDEHTWGADVKTWLTADRRVYEKQAFLCEKEKSDYQFMQKSWDEQRLRATHMQSLLKEGEKRILERHSANTPAAVNPNGASFTGWAEVLSGCGETAIFGKPHRFVRDIPALCVKELPQAEPQAGCDLSVTVSGGIVEVQNHRYLITLDETQGQITCVFDKVLNVPLLKSTDCTGIFSYIYYKYGKSDMEKYLQDYCQIYSDWGIKDNGRENYPDCEQERFAPELIGWKADGSTLTLKYQCIGADKYGNAETAELNISLPPFGDELFVELKLIDKQESPYVESGSFVIPFAGAEAEYAFNKNGCLINPATDIADNANHALYCLEAFALMGNKRAGVCVVSHDVPLVAIGETGIYTFRKQYEKHEPSLHFNLFNNMWGTNFPQWIGGDLCYRFTLFGFQPDENVTQRALTIYQGVKIESLPDTECPFVLPDGVQVSALIPTGEGGILRLRDTAGAARLITVACKNAGWEIRESDLFGNPSDQSAGLAVTMRLERYGIKTFAFKTPR